MLHCFLPFSALWLRSRRGSLGHSAAVASFLDGRWHGCAWTRCASCTRAALGKNDATWEPDHGCRNAGATVWQLRRFGRQTHETGLGLAHFWQAAQHSPAEFLRLVLPQVTTSPQYSDFSSAVGQGLL